jgi:hypothetical protein
MVMMVRVRIHKKHQVIAQVVTVVNIRVAVAVAVIIIRIIGVVTVVRVLLLFERVLI